MSIDAGGIMHEKLTQGARRARRARPMYSPKRAKPLVGAPLTPREIEVMTLVAEGLSNKLVAERLTLSEHTAHFHVTNAMAKLGAGSRTGAAVKFVLARMIVGCQNCARPAVPA